MSKRKPETIYTQAFVSYGADAQYIQLQEECAELIVALCHFRRGRIGPEEVCSEIADVRIMIEQAREMLGRKLVDEKYKEKLAVLEERIYGKE